MKRKHFIGLDVHCKFCELVVVSESGRVVHRQRCATTIPELVKAIEAVRSPRYVALEESALADWLWRNLAGHADEIMVCDPRRNYWISQAGDKDDPLDAEKLAQLLRGGYLKPVHHPESVERTIFKQHVTLYYDRVRQRVRTANRIGAVLRQYGVFVKEADFATAEQRQALLRRLPSSRLLHRNLQLLWHGYEVTAKQVDIMRRRLIKRARQEEVIRRFVAVPGVKWIRAATIFVYLDTPWRFRSKQALWKYMCLGLERRHSGNGPMRVQLIRQANRRLKYVLLGAARSAVAAGSNPFVDQERRWLRQGIPAPESRRNTARSLGAVLWGMWKNGNAYHPEWVGKVNAVRTVWG